MNSSVFDRVAAQGIVAVLVIDNENDAVPVAEALLKGGVSAMELTLRTDAAMGALRLIRQQVPEMLAGIGTILKVDQVHAVRDAGAAFGVSPGVNKRVIEAAQSLGLPFAPGIVTPSEIEQALETGCDVLKFFPAEPSGGLDYLKAIAAPYEHLGLRYLPLGGLHLDNMSHYLSYKSVAAIGGSWIAKRNLITEKRWPEISENARTAIEKAHASRANATV